MDHSAFTTTHYTTAMSNDNSTGTMSIPTMMLVVASTGDCLDFVCPTAVIHSARNCTGTPRYLDSIMKAAVKNKKCKTSDFSLLLNPGMTASPSPWTYPTVCTFGSQECAQKVCGLQTSSINSTDPTHWKCFSDPIVAQALSDTTYWFANDSSSCHGTKTDCKDILPLGWQVYSSAQASTVSRNLALALVVLTVGSVCGVIGGV